MPKQLNVDLRFNADTSQAKKQIQDLQQTLSKLGAGSAKNLGFEQMTSEIAQATNQVNILKAQIDNAFNAKTGKLDLTRFTQDMQKSGMTLEKYRDALIKLGPEGSQAFAKLATSISQAEIPLKRTNKLLAEMGTVLKNTIKWQLSSTMIHGFMGAVQQAYGYAQDLNESLTNIRIVTGQSTDQMAAFATQANKAAQALSTTTTAYTDAALIFYQQGLSDSEVEERTNAVIKMSQATGDAATDVSSYMTAVWNNFDNGAESLEHYADVITALGAATASSSSEIAQGLEKFASIADTVGLSYEYATTALATVVAQTRQSADVVGTAFKTMFARFQDLELGKTLEDGTDLGQYSKALAKVGVDIKDANGELRDMDDILDDLGAKWATLADDEKVALAQNVAGQRQYAQLVALMDNWDTFQENLITANSAEGTLQKQADIYAESWEAAQKRVKASMESIYQSVIDDKFFIQANNFLADNLNGVNNLIKTLGGLPGLLSTIGSLVTTFFGAQLADGVRAIGEQIAILSPKMREFIKSQQEEALRLAKGTFVDDEIGNQVFQNKLELQEKYLQNAENLNALEAKTVEYGMQQVDALGQQVIEAEKLKKAAEEEQAIIVKTLREKAFSGNTRHDRRQIITRLSDATARFDDAYQEKNNLGDLGKLGRLDSLASEGASPITPEYFEKIKQEALDLAKDLHLVGDAYTHIEEAAKQAEPAQFSTKIRSALAQINTDVEKTIGKYDSAQAELRNVFVELAGSETEGEKLLERYMEAVANGVDAEAELNRLLEEQKEKIRVLDEYMQQASGNTIDWANAIVGIAQGFMQVSMIINQLKGLGEIWTDEDASLGDKILSTMTSLGFVIPMVIKGIKSLTSAKTLSAIASGLLAGSEEKQLAARLMNLSLDKKEQAEIIGLITSKKLLSTQTDAETVKEDLETVAKLLNIKVTDKMSASDLQAAIAKKILGTQATLTATQIAASTGAILLLVAAIALFVYACKQTSDAYNADAIAAEKAQKAATNLADAYNAAAEAYNEMKQTVSDYQSARDALNELTKGTQEYTDALFEANEAAMKLIETGKISADQYSWENGAIVIDDNVLEAAQQSAQQDMLNLQAASQIANAQARQAQNQANLVAIRRSDDGLIPNDVQNAIGATLLNSVGGSAGIYANIASALFTGNTLGDHFYDSQMSSEWGQQAEIERLAERYQEVGAAAFEGVFEEGGYFADATDSMVNSIKRYCEQVAEADAATQAYAQQIAHANLSTEEYSDEIINFAASQYEEKVAEKEAEVRNIFSDFDAFTTYNNAQAQDLFAQYAEATGLQNASLTGVVGTQGNIRFQYLDESGETRELNEDQIATAIAASEAIQNLGESAQQAADFLSDLPEESRDFYEQAFGNFRNGHVNFSEFAGDYLTTGGETIDTSAWDTIYSAGTDEDVSEYIDTAVEEGLSVLQAYGIETTDDLRELATSLGVDYTELFNDLMQGYANEMESFETYLNNQSDAAEAFYDKEDFSDLTHTQTRSVLDAYALAEENGANRMFERITSNMAPEVMAEFAETLEGVDWSSINSREFLQLLSDSGFEIEGFEDVLKEFCSSMRTVTAETLAASAEFFNGLQKIADGLSDQNDEISAEDFASLPEDMQQFFALTIDGTYKLLGAARDFQEYVEQSRIQEAIDNRNALYSQYDEARREMSATDVNKMQESGYAQGAASDEYAQYLAADMAIALHYDDLSELQRAYAEGTVATVEAFNTAAYQIDQAQDTAMLDQEAWQNYSDYIREAGSALEGFNDEMDDLEADIVAKSIMKMNQAVETLSSNFDEWRDVLENSTEASAEYADALIGTRKAIAMLLDISEDYVSSDFVTEHLDLIAQAAEGDAEAIDQLRVELSQDVGSMLASAVSSTEADAAKIESWLNELTAQALAFDDLEVGASLYLDGKDGFVEALNEMIAATGMTVDQVNALCDSMGFEANFASEGQRIPTTIPEYTTHHEIVNQKPQKVGDQEATTWDEITWTEQTGEHKAEGEAMAYAFTTDGTTPKINSVTKKASGSANNSSSSNRGGSRSSGGGGGGKSSSQKKPKDPTGEIERYHVINNQIEDNEKALTRLSKAKDRAYGRARLNAMDAEIAKQRESVELAERKLQEVQKYLELDSGAIAAFGAEFDANGTIVNYDQLMQQQIDKYNTAVEAYNNSSMDENAEAVFQQAEDDYNAFTEALKQYEETQDLWYEQAQAVADAKAEVLQLELEKTNYKVEIGIEWEEEDIARLDFMLKRIEDDAHKAAEAIGLLGERTVDAMDKYNVYQQGFTDTLRNLGVGNAEDVFARASAGEDLYGMIGGIVDPNQMAQAVDQMDDYISNMMSSLEDAQDSVDQAFEKVKDLFNENVKQMDTYIEKIEFCQKITKSYMNIVDIIGKKSLGITNEMLRTFNAESVTQAVNNEAAAKAKMDSIQAQLMESQARLAQASGEAEQKYWNEIIEEQEKELISATENFHQAWEDALQANLEAFENNIELVIEDFSNAVGDLNAMKAEWDLQKSLTDMWEPEYERWHQLSDLINDINKSVDENENLKYKQDLLDLEQEIAALQEEEAQLSEYDLNYLRLRYEAKLAEIALEEAQNAKSQVRMLRDNEGNYSYVYTADEDAVNNAADDYRNKIYEMEKANEEYIDTLQEQLLDMHDKMLEDIKEAGDLYGIGTEAYFEAVDRIEQTYLGQSQFIQAQMQNVFDNNQRLRDEDIIQYVAYTGDIAAQNVDLQLSFADTYMGIQTQSDNLNTYFNDTWIPALETTFDNAREVTDHYVETNEVAMETAGTTMDEFSARATQDMAMATAQTEELARQTKNYGDIAVRAFAQAAQAWQTGPGSMLNAIESQAAAIANLAQQYTSLKSQLDAATASAIALANAMNQPVSSSPSTAGGAAASGGSGGGGGGSYSGGSSGGQVKDTLTNNTAKDTMTKDTYGKGALVQAGKSTTSSSSGNGSLLKRVLQFASGGYTGEWSDEPRWALLDQKELVLNTKDTMNLLSAVDVVRQLANSIDLNTMSANIAGASIKSASGTPGTIEQKVEITASFPNATDRNEIEQAFQNLVNHASQYANRKD